MLQKLDETVEQKARLQVQDWGCGGKADAGAETERF